MYTDNWQELGAKGIEHERSWPDLSLMQARWHVGTCSATLRIPLLFHAKKGLCWISVCPLYGSIVALTLRRHDATTHAPLLATVRRKSTTASHLAAQIVGQTLVPDGMFGLQIAVKSEANPKSKRSKPLNTRNSAEVFVVQQRWSSPSLQKVCHSEELGSQVSLIFLGSRFHEQDLALFHVLLHGQTSREARRVWRALCPSLGTPPSAAPAQLRTSAAWQPEG